MSDERVIIATAVTLAAISGNSKLLILDAMINTVWDEPDTIHNRLALCASTTLECSTVGASTLKLWSAQSTIHPRLEHADAPRHPPKHFAYRQGFLRFLLLGGRLQATA